MGDRRWLMAHGSASPWSIAAFPISPQPWRRRGRGSPRGGGPRPDGSLIFAFRHRLHPLVEEALQAAAVVRLGRISISLRVGRDAVDRVELSRHLAAVAEAREDLSDWRSRIHTFSS